MKLYKHTMKELFSFNRYMVECELGDSLSDIASGLSFNRYMVECELVRTAVIFFMLKVLIDTWWNVNKLISGGQTVTVCFNRYMVECEYP